MTKNAYIYICVALLCFACNDDDFGGNGAVIGWCENYPTQEINGKIMGEYGSYVHHEKAIDLADGICLISSDEIQILPYDTTSDAYQLEDLYNFRGVVVNEFDTIVLRKNIFYRFYPSSRTFVPIYAPRYTVHDFCVTPNHGIGFFWGNIFSETTKFNYFNFKENQNQTLFELVSFMPDTQYREYHTYLEGDRLKLLMKTKNSADFSTEKGVFYRIDLDEVQIESREEYKGRSGLSILDFNNFNDLSVTYVDDRKLVITTLDLMEQKYDIGYRFPSSWTETNSSIKGDYVSIAYHTFENKMELANWKTGETLFSIPTPKEYHTAFVRIGHYQDKYVLLYQERANVALVYDLNNCALVSLIGNSNIKEILYLDEEKIVLRNELNEVEHFSLK